MNFLGILVIHLSNEERLSCAVHYTVVGAAPTFLSLSEVQQDLNCVSEGNTSRCYGHEKSDPS